MTAMACRALLSLWLFLLLTSTAAAGGRGVNSADADSVGHLNEVLAQARQLAHEGKLVQAIEQGQSALRMAEEAFGTQSAEYAQALSDVAGIHSRAGAYQEALRMGYQALDIRRQVVGEHHVDYATSLNNVARYHSYLGQTMEAVRMGRKAMELREELLGKDDADYAKSVSNMAGYFARMGNYDEAIKMGQEALDIRQKTLPPHHTDCIESLNNLAKYHYFKGEYAQAIDGEQRALDALRSDTSQLQSPLYATILSNLADFCMKTGREAEAMQHGNEALQLRRQMLGEHHPDYAESLSNMATYHYECRQYADAIDLQRQALQLQRQLLGEEHPACVQSTCMMAVFFLANEQTDSAEIYAYKATNHYTNVILNTFADLTASERDMYWRKVKPWFTNTLLQMAEKCPTEKMLSSAFNGTLLAKGLLLKSELEMVNLLMESGDQTAVTNYKALQANRWALLRQLELPKNERTLNIDSLRRVITKQERRLVRLSKTYGSYTQQLQIGWERIAQIMGPKDLAIEFVRYRSSDGTGRYAALVVGGGARHPEFIPLMDDDQLHAIDAKQVYSSTQLTERVWLPLKSHLAKARRVYFAPAGELYNIAIESLPVYDGKPGEVMSDRWQLYRLSSTRMLATRRQQTADGSTPPRGEKGRPASATVFGGMNYDAPLDADLAVGSSAQEEMEEALKPFENEEHNGLKYLPGTKREAEEIAQVLQTDSIATTLLEADVASEHSFKALSGHAPALLHIATHGFYWTDSDIKASAIDERLQFLAADAAQNEADKALTRSGLFFAGANRTLLGMKDDRRKNDGVLTAQEISLLDLRGLQLLVLSACQTGLGKVTGDGVFGLQRGFKKAGAQSLLMSLWKVDDKATRILMSLFYKHLTEGKGKHEALRLAQQQLRTMDVEAANRRARHAISSRAKRARKGQLKKQYEDPYYWAAFILLDAIE